MLCPSNQELQVLKAKNKGRNELKAINMWLTS